MFFHRFKNGSKQQKQTNKKFIEHPLNKKHKHLKKKEKIKKMTEKNLPQEQRIDHRTDQYKISQ